MGYALNVLDLFAGAGGFSTGFKQAGFNIVGALEQNISAAKTYAKNHPETLMIITDIKQVNLLDSRIDLIIGGPPCQGYTKATCKNKDLRYDDTDERNLLYKEYIRIVENIKPKAFVMENVPALLTYKRGLYFNDIKESLLKLGYYVDAQELDASDYNVPQKRVRLFIVGIYNRSIPIPTPTKASTEVSVKTALEQINLNIPIRRQKYIYHELLTLIPPGGNWEDLDDEIKTKYFSKNTPSYMLRRNHPGKPSFTIMGKHGGWVGPYHHEEIRSYSLEEKALLQGFDISYVFEGNHETKKLMIGNAVPPPLAKAIAEMIREII